MTKTIKQLQKEAAKAPQFILKLDGLDLYLSSSQRFYGSVNLTKNKKKAMTFSLGFDDVQTKIKAWSIALQMLTNNKETKFEAINL